MLTKGIAVAVLFIVAAGVVSLEFGILTAIAEILGGVIAHNLFGLDYINELELLSSMGIVALMYVAGLEIDFDLMKKNAKSAVCIGTMSFFVPLLLVLLLASLLLGYLPEKALLLAIGLSTTSLALVYPALTKDDCSLCDTDKGILAAAMVTDVIGMILLAVFYSKLSYFTIVLVLAMMALSIMAPLLGKKVFKRYGNNTIEFEFKLVLLIILALTVLSEEAGIESAIIAFLAGVMTSEIIVDHEHLTLKLRAIVFGLLAPVFFFTVGLSVNFSNMTSALPLIIVFLVVAFTGKYIGTYLSSRRFFKKKAKFISILFNQRLSLGIVVATFGLTSGLFDTQVYTGLLGAIIFSALLASILLRGNNG